MDVWTGRWVPGTGFSSPPPNWDGPSTLVSIFGAEILIEKADPITELVRAYPTSVVMGCSTAGEILNGSVDDEGLSVSVCRFESTRLSLVSGTFEGWDSAREVGRRLGGQLVATDPELSAVFVLCDGMRTNGAKLALGFSEGVGDRATITGGLAGDGLRIEKSWVLLDGRPHRDAVTAVGLSGPRLRVSHGTGGGWNVLGPERRVTRSEGNILYELDGQPALALYRSYLGDRARELPGAALLFPLSVRALESDDEPVVRSVKAIDEDAQSLILTGDIPQNTLTRLLWANMDDIVEGVADAFAQLRLDASAPALALMVSCIGRRVVLGPRIEDELEVTRLATSENFQSVGFYSFGEIAPIGPGSSGLFNQTMSITTFQEPEERRPELHRVLKKQLGRLGVDPRQAPAGVDPDLWFSLLETVTSTYAQADQDRYTLERAIEVSSTEMRSLHEDLLRKALFDDLTGLPNRRALMAELQRLMTVAQVAPHLAVLFIDLDGFKLVNDRLGHEAGDELLVRMAERLRLVCRDGDVVARLGGDEFIVAGAFPDGGVAQAQEFAERIAAEIQAPLQIQGQEVLVGASIGVAISEGADTDIDAILRRADFAMYESKSAGRLLNPARSPSR